MAWQLPIVEIEGELFFNDVRMQEYRHVKKVMHYIPYGQIGDRTVKLVEPAKELPHPKKKKIRHNKQSLLSKLHERDQGKKRKRG